MKLSSMPAAVGAGGYSGRGWQRGMRRRIGSLNSSSLMCPTKTKTTTRSESCGVQKKACKKFKAMTMKAGKKRKRAAASFFLPLPMYSRIWRSLFLPLIFLQLAKKDPDVLLLPRLGRC